MVEKYDGDHACLPFYYFDIYNAEDVFVGKISIKIGENYHSYYDGHIGYEIIEAYRGNHFSYYAAKLVIQVAKAHGMSSLYITCKQSNIASITIIEKLGAVRKEIASIPKDCFFYHEGIEAYCIYSLKI